MSPEKIEDRVLILAPRGRDAQLAANVLAEAGLTASPCSDAAEFLAALGEGGGAAMIAQEALDRDSCDRICGQLAQQPPWSDFPIIIFTARSASAIQHRRVVEGFGELGNITTIERPIHPSTLVSAVSAALRARHRQYQTRSVLAQREREVRQRDQFLAMLGHELRNPLAAITNAKELVDRATTSVIGVQRPLSIIDRQVRNLNHLVDDLLDVARVTSGKIALKTVSVDLGALVRNAIDEVQRGKTAAHVSIESVISNDRLLVRADPVRLDQVVGNILTNAIKYTPAGGRVVVTVDTCDGKAQVCIRDSGVGMSRETLSSVFEPFTQADRTLERSQGGMGLGLTVVRTLVELHGGTVDAASPGLGLGSVFTVRLPVLAVTEAKLKTPTPQPIAVRTLASARHILIIEDSADVRDSLQELLQSEGHRVDVASDGEQGVQSALALHPEIALVDIGLPRLDGYGVARKVRASVGDSIFLVALTGYGQPEDRSRAHEAGFDVHLTKPVEMDALDQVLARAGHPATAVPHLSSRSVSAVSAGRARFTSR
jgi:signal transduction histidine kinase/ActR/RegA family two-component response regulator